MQQAEFTSRKFLTYITNKNKTIISKPIELSNIAIQIRHSFENTISNKLKLFHRLNSMENQNEYKFINNYIQHRIEKLKIEEKTIEQILPILGKRNYLKENI